MTAHAAIAPLGWLVFVEVPLSEAFAPLYGQAARSLVLLLLGLGIAAIAAFAMARRMTGPIRELQTGAARIGAGELDRRIDIPAVARQRAGEIAASGGGTVGSAGRRTGGWHCQGY